MPDGLYLFSQPLQHCLPSAFLGARIFITNWHCRLDHVFYGTIKHVLHNNNLHVGSIMRQNICPECTMAKSHNLPFSTSISSVFRPLELIYSDVWGSSSVVSTYGSCYYVCFLDAFTKFIWIFPLKLKSDVEPIFIEFQKYVERHFNLKIKAIQTDWKGEYRSLNNYLKSCGIQHRISCLYTHEQMGSVERRHHQIVEMGLAFLANSNLP
jgi:histone deacetylase 1/2